MRKEKQKIKYSVQFTFVGIFFVFLAVTIALLNIYPTTSARDVVFSAKQGSLMNQTAVMASSLSALEKLSPEGVEQVMSLIGAGDYDRVLVTDQDGVVIYDSLVYGGILGSHHNAELLNRALSGHTVFSSRYTGKVFESTAAAPVMSFGTAIGAVYLYEKDAEQAELITSIQGRLRNISVIAGSVTLIVIIIFSKALTRRIRELVKGMRIVREGNYAHRVLPKGGDEVRELSEEFNNMTLRLQNTDEMRRRFVSDASHELRTPLASIRLLSDSIVQSENMDEATMREFVTDIGTEAERLQRLTEKLMRLTRIDSKISTVRTAVDMKKVAERTIHLLNPLALERDVTIHKDFEESCTVYANEDDIYQIMFNLAENAIKYNVRNGSVFLHLRQEAGEAVFSVEDTGIGIPEEDIPNIFNRFYRVDKARSRAHGGSGLGLSIVRDTVHAHGGTVRVELRETGGSCFTVCFPVYHEKQEEQA